MIVTKKYLKKKFPGNHAMHEVIDYIKPGRAGRAGAKWHHVTTALFPAAGLGSSGDYALVTYTGKIYIFNKVINYGTGVVEWVMVADLTAVPQIQSDWTQATNTAVDFIKNKPTIPGADTAIKIAIDFVDAAALVFVYNCPVNLKFTSQESEGADATISPALNTDMAQYGKVTITAPAVGLIVLNGVTL